VYSCGCNSFDDFCNFRFLFNDLHSLDLYYLLLLWCLNDFSHNISNSDCLFDLLWGNLHWHNGLNNDLLLKFGLLDSHFLSNYNSFFNHFYFRVEDLDCLY